MILSSTEMSRCVRSVHMGSSCRAPTVGHMTSPTTRAVSVRVTGQVQGVSFRWYAVQEAERLGVTGWVRNEPDGSVRCHVEGDDPAVDAIVELCLHGPSYASVRHVAVAEARPIASDAFDIRY